MRPVRRTLWGLLALGLVAAASVAADFAFLRGRTPGLGPAPAVASLEKVRIGGVDQWLLVRGKDRAKPVLLFLHGGPGMPVMFLAHDFQRELEEDFVVVHWDRRGAGKSFDALRPGQSTSVGQTLDDTLELTRMLRSRFGQERVYLAGHSWGSYLGLLAVREHPEYYAAYIGMGQLAGSRPQVQAIRKEFLTRAATAAADGATMARLGNPDYLVTEDDLFRFGGELYGRTSFWPILKTGLCAPEYEFRDVLDVKKGSDRVSREMVYDLSPKPMEGEIPKAGVPVFFFLGRHDFNTPSSLAAEYLERLDAPLKRLAWFERSAHFPFFEEPERFRSEMLLAHRAASAYWSARPDGHGAALPAPGSP